MTMMIFKKAIPRRTFLRGAGAAIALPFLDAMIPAFAAADAAARPLRLGYVYLPLGRIMENWTPKQTGTDFELTPALKPLADYRDQMLLISGLDIKAADLKPGERGGPHARPCAAYLTGVHPFNNSVGISVDQVIAKEVTGKHTPLASMQLGTDPAEWAGGNEVDYEGFYRSTVSWSTPTTPLPTQDNPRKIFERLFGDTDSVDPEAMRQRIARQGSVLDSVSGRVNKLMSSINTNDRYKLEEYLTAVRDIERGIQVAEAKTVSGDGVAHDMKRPAGIPALYADHARLLFDLMFLAFQTDMTRVITLMMGHEGTNRNYTELGAKDGHHSLSHHKGFSAAIELLKKIDVHQSELLAEFLAKMRSTQDGDGTTLLDNTLLFTGSAMSDANNHLHNDVPIALFGSAQGRIKGGRHVRHDGVPLSNLHLAVLEMFGAPAEEFLSGETSDATGVLKGLS
jgi:hypothetical protein